MGSHKHGDNDAECKVWYHRPVRNQMCLLQHWSDSGEEGLCAEIHSASIRLSHNMSALGRKALLLQCL
jgi:hypothetical protein